MPSDTQPSIIPSLWKFGGLTPLRLTQQVTRKFDDDEVLTRSSSLSYYFLLALFPMLLFLVSLIGIVAGPHSEFREAVVSTLGNFAPGSATGLIRNVLSQTVKSSGGLKLGIGILGALWAASGGMSALIVSLNVINHVEESRPWFKLRGTTIALTIALAILVLIPVALIFYGTRIENVVAAGWGGHALRTVWKFVEWAVSLACMFLSFSVVYYFGPNLNDRKWYWQTPGAVLGVIVWLATSLGFRLYLHFFDSYSATYGFIGAVIILMLWLYLTGMAILIGAEVNSVIEFTDRHTAEITRREQQIQQRLQAA